MVSRIMFSTPKNVMPTIEIVEKLLSEISYYKYAKDANHQTRVEMLGFAFALYDKNYKESDTYRVVKERMIRELMECIYDIYPASYRNIHWDNLYENSNGYKMRFLNIGLRHKKGMIESVQKELIKVMDEIFEFIHDLLESTHKNSKYLFLGQHAESHEKSTYNAEYILVVDSENERVKNYFAAFNYLYNFFMTYTGFLAINKENPLLQKYKDYFHCLERRYGENWKIQNLQLQFSKIDQDAFVSEFHHLQKYFKCEENSRNEYSLEIHNFCKLSEEQRIEMIRQLPDTLIELHIDDNDQKEIIENLRDVRTFVDVYDTTRLNLDLTSIVMNYATHFSAIEKKAEKQNMREVLKTMILKKG